MQAEEYDVAAHGFILNGTECTIHGKKIERRDGERKSSGGALTKRDDDAGARHLLRGTDGTGYRMVS